MDQEFADAFSQELDGWPGLRALLLEWLLYATSREARSMLRRVFNMVKTHNLRSRWLIRASIFLKTHLRIHRSPQLRRTLEQFFRSERNEWTEIERNTALDRAIMYLPWRNDSFQSIYQLARRYLFPNGQLMVKINHQDQLQILILNELNFHWRIIADIIP